jgi:phytoene synthase
MAKRSDYCAALVRAADHDRYLATLFAPAEQRGALYALYAFAAEIAQVRELAREPMPGEIRLQWWREALTGERDEEAAANPVAAALREALVRHDIASDQLVAVIDAHTFDLYNEPMASLSDLERYGEQAQGVVFDVAGRMLAGQAPASKSFFRHIGIASTILGLLRALPRHVLRRQLFVPLDLLRRHAVEPETVFAEIDSPALRAALRALREEARSHLAAAQAEYRSVADEMLPALLPVATIAPTLKLMERANNDPFNSATLSPWRRQWLIWRAARKPQRIFHV